MLGAAGLFLIRRASERFEKEQMARGNWNEKGPLNPSEAPPEGLRGNMMNVRLEVVGKWKDGRPVAVASTQDRMVAGSIEDRAYMFLIGDAVRIGDVADLERFQRLSAHPDPLPDSYFKYAGQVAEVIDTGYYPDGDNIYRLKGIPGVWHEGCLSRAASA